MGQVPDAKHPSRDNCTTGAPLAVDLTSRGAAAYCRMNDLPAPDLDLRHVRSNPRTGRRIAAAYLAGLSCDPAASAAYQAFRNEIVAQFDFLTGASSRGGLGVCVEVRAEDPYPDATSMMRDLRDHGRLRVYGTVASANEHPYLSNDDNDMFRAVHDAFGHAATGRGFDRHGEEAAWIKHSVMFSPLAQRAMTTETRGQTCTFIYHFNGTRFPEQKMLLLPARFWRWRTALASGGGGHRREHYRRGAATSRSSFQP